MVDASRSRSGGSNAFVLVREVSVVQWRQGHAKMMLSSLAQIIRFHSLLLPLDGFLTATSRTATETSSDRIRPQLPVKKKQASREGRLLNLSDVALPEEIRQVLQKGPKFSVEPALRPEEKIDTARAVSKL
ncbi:hypothetical protein HPB52_023435 [Rhipicephalus sanguineus]|uniref:Uncharacterized protein n=1 Tax=Rhipicephalus sanguineus TaxID=34632 RepID=A0A9D4SPK0_RHISA|nr:hypothetical protein HPB52_023435 [Rhipicephalus sanguineus]